MIQSLGLDLTRLLLIVLENFGVGMLVHAVFPRLEGNVTRSPGS
jgi:hypothetical protein